MERLKIKEYAELKNISIPTVYKQINKGFIKVYKEGRNVFIEVEEKPEHEKTTKTESKIETLLKEIELLREQNKELKKDKDILNQRLQESNIIQIKTIESFKQLEYRQQETEKELQEERKKNWWQKLFKRGKR